MPEIGEIKQGQAIGKTRGKLYIWEACSDCGLERWTRIRKGNPEPVAKYCNRCSAARVNGAGSACHNWQGGYRRMSSGYVLVWVSKEDFFYSMADSDGYIREHRLIMAKHLGRCLQKWEVVHHKNGIKDDNRLENLEVTERAGHIQSHSKGYRDGYRNGFMDGQNTQIRELKTEIRLLRLQLKEKQNAY